MFLVQRLINRPRKVSLPISLGQIMYGLHFSLKTILPSLTLLSTTAVRTLPGQSGAIRTPLAFSLSAFLTTFQINPTGGWKYPIPDFQLTPNASSPLDSPTPNLAKNGFILHARSEAKKNFNLYPMKPDEI